ncbi:MAG: Arginyl-tRNA synthetase (EC [uncultured Sulfurovum sp.]|uniref:Arginine--tRNA ligase n=1 Tax=uncultured Sulfurovum sp. TaxID=269237 RepID=A0A6S6SPA5_9BACT|nr:MAG: Arginyl-tRNA synthetase (EC [uncultured Sulfurovum sp.]
MKIKLKLSKIIEDALKNANIQADEIVISDATKPEFGDYQFNGVMKLAKVLKQNPRQIATVIVEHIDTTGMIAKVEVAGPGFINIWLNKLWLSQETTAILDDIRVGVGQVEVAQKVVVDYSGPNMAKQMHVGHLRSSIIGDTLSTLLEFLGEEVIRQNHIGDWGTQFGMLIAYLEEQNTDGNTQELKDLEQFYKDAKVRFDESEDFANKARDYVVKIQSGDEHCLRLWQSFIDASLGHCEDVYAKLNVNLTREDVRAESFYNDQLPQVIETLKEKGISRTSNGAECVFLEGDETPIIIQKGDGGYLYATTDLAALNFRDKVLKADRICYVVDARQAQHFKQVFTIAKQAAMVKEEVALEHIGFGTMMGQGGKPFKTREGGTPKLSDLLDEAILRAKDTIKERDVHSEAELNAVAKAIGIGAVKYADLSISRESNYIFNWDKMLSFEGNTSLYMQYAYARIQSIVRKHNAEITGDIVIADEVEHRLALLLLKFEDTLTKAAIEATPHTITSYLYDVVTVFMKFYELNPILKDDIEEEIKMSRLQLATLTASVIEKGLSILGIEVIEKI